MTECNYFDAFNMKSTCRLCLQTSKDVYAMSTKEINLYRSFVSKIPNSHWDINMCLYCGWMMKKFQRFIQQCQETNEMLSQLMDVDSKSFVFINKPSGNLTISQTETYNFNTFNLDDCEDNIQYGDDFDDVPLVMLSNDDYTDDVKHMRKRSKKKKHKLNSDLEQKREIKDEEELENKEYKKNKRKKLVKEGFSSKMVQETNEYIVIKLTREQVLQEMREKSQSESYSRAPYKCEHCVKGFNFEDVLLNHMDKHTMKPGYFACDMCSQYCPTPVSLRGHIKSHTTRYKCKLCGHVRLSRQHLLEHYALTHTSAHTMYTCDHCTFTSNKRTVIQRHVKSHSPGESHTCHECGRLFNNINSLRVHTVRHDKSKRLRCQHCNKGFVMPSLLQKHVLSVHDRKDYYCVECDVKFKTPETMRLHFKRAKRHREVPATSYKCASVPGQVSHPCALCPRSYSTRASLRAHKSHTHKKQDPQFTEEIQDTEQET